MLLGLHHFTTGVKKAKVIPFEGSVYGSKKGPYQTILKQWEDFALSGWKKECALLQLAVTEKAKGVLSHSSSSFHPASSLCLFQCLAC